MAGVYGASFGSGSGRLALSRWYRYSFTGFHSWTEGIEWWYQGGRRMAFAFFFSFLRYSGLLASYFLLLHWYGYFRESFIYWHGMAV